MWIFKTPECCSGFILTGGATSILMIVEEIFGFPLTTICLFSSHLIPQQSMEPSVTFKLLQVFFFFFTQIIVSLHTTYVSSTADSLTKITTCVVKGIPEGDL